MTQQAQNPPSLTEQEINVALLDPTKHRSIFSYVVNLYSERIYWQIRKMGISHDDTDDIVQNTFMKAWTNLSGFRGDSKISTWLYRIAANESLTFISNQSKASDLRSDSVGDIASYSIASDPYFEGDELQKKLFQAIEELPPKQRLVFNMRYFDELPYEEMSSILGTSVGALKASYHHAAKKIEVAILGAY